MSFLVSFGTFSIISTIMMTAIYSSTVHIETFRSPPITLYPGQMINSDMNTYELDWPRKPIAVTYFDSEVIDEDGNAVALYDLYIHHYLIASNAGRHSAGPCYYNNIWGIGAEMRGTIYEYPSNYAMMFDGTENFTANLHFIRTDTIANNLHQLCIECHCWDGTPDDPNGGLNCCYDGAYCWGAPMPNDTTLAKTYYMQYTFKYTDVTNGSSDKSLEMFTYDVTAEDTFDCRIEYQIPESAVSNDRIDTRRNVSKVLQDTDIVLVEMHQHVGGVEMSIEHYRNGTYIDTMCTASPHYGNGTTVGNENGYVVKIPTCTFDTPYQVKKGDELRLTSLYNARHISGGNNFHEGVMGIVFYWGERTGPSKCEETLKTLCGNPLPSTSEACYECADKNIEFLYYAECGGEFGSWSQIVFLCKTDNGVKTNYKIDHVEIDYDNEMYKDIKQLFPDIVDFEESEYGMN